MKKEHRMSRTYKKAVAHRKSIMAISILCLAFLVGMKSIASGFDPIIEETDLVESIGDSNGIFFIEEDETPYILQDGGNIDLEPEIYASDSQEALVKSRIAEGIRAWETSIDLSEYYPGTMDENKANLQKVFGMFRQIVNENPDLFYVSGSIGGAYGYHFLQLRLNYENYTQDDIARFYDVANGVIERIPSSYTDLDKFLFLHDYLVTHCKYDMTLSKHNAFNALVEGSSVCQGYSVAYRYLCSLAGLDAKVVSSNELNHAWNIVTYNGQYYFVDTTWDDPVNINDPAYCRHDNFMRSTSGMVETDHTSSDWIREDGVNVYGYATDDSLYSNSSWKNVINVILEGEEKEQEYWGNPVIIGDARTGQILAAQIIGGNISGPYTYQWKRNKISILNATSQTYKLANDDIGKTITCEIRKDGKNDILIAKLNEKVIFDSVAATELKIVQNSITLKVGSSAQLNYILKPSSTTDSILWGSDDTSVVAIDQQGNIVAKSAGSTTVWVMTVKNELDETNRKALKASCTVTVNDPTPVTKSVTEITLNKPTAKLTTGQTLTLKATVEPSDATDKTITWTTSNKSVATVSTKGVVTAVGAGTATITVTANDGSGIKSTCKVTVNDPAPVTKSVTGITLNKPTAKLTTGQTLTLKATVEPSDATDKTITWTTSNKSVATVSTKGVVTAVGAGTATITVTANDGSGTKSTCKVTVSNPAPVTKSVTEVFKDIQKSDWWLEAVQYVYDHGIMAGSDIGFEPRAYLTREQFVQVLYNHSGKPGAKGIANKFSDVKDVWYKDAVLWGSKNDITSGYDDGRFGVGDKITREQLTVMLYKYAKMKGFNLTVSKGLTDQYKDGKKVDSWAKEAMNWAVSQGIMSGKGTGTDKSQLLLDPLGNATRAECATMIMKLLVKNGIN